MLIVCIEAAESWLRAAEWRNLQIFAQPFLSRPSL